MIRTQLILTCSCARILTVMAVALTQLCLQAKTQISAKPVKAVQPLTGGGALLQTQKLTGSEATSNDYFGYSVALSSDGTTALVGSWGNQAAYVFTLVDGNWTQQQKLTASDGGLNDDFGQYVALSGDGNTALIGAIYRNHQTGAAYVYNRSGTTWTLQQELAPANNGADGFGNSVALSGDGNTALVGSPLDNSSKGAAYVFTRNGTTWTQQQFLIAPDGQTGAQFGGAVALSSDGTTALIGGWGTAVTVAAQGSAYLFTRSANSWTQQQELTASDPETDAQFGTALALSGDGKTALVGAQGQTFTQPNQGAAYLFTAASGWAQQQELTATGGMGDDFFGRSVALSSDGGTALIGDAARTITQSNQGTATLYTAASGWAQQQELTASDAGSDDYFGESVAMSADASSVLVGAAGNNSNTGAAYVFTAASTAVIAVGGVGSPSQFQSASLAAYQLAGGTAGGAGHITLSNGGLVVDSRDRT